MAKREDWEVLSKLSKNNKGISHIYSQLPLIVFDKNIIDKYKSIGDKYNNYNNLITYLLSTPILFNHFICKITFSNSIYEYIKCRFTEDEHVYSLIIQSNRTSGNIISCLQLIFSKEKNKVISNRIYFMKPLHKCVIIYEFDEVSNNPEFVLSMSHDTWLNNLNNTLLIILGFFNYIAESDFYPVETKGIQRRRRPNINHDKKPWQRSDLVTIKFLNQLPRESSPSESKGGHHASPYRHQVRGFNRVMKHERFKDNPNFGKEMWIKPFWRGVKESTVNGITYKVIDNPENK